MVLNGILWLRKSGAHWRDLPARYGNWNSVYHKFRQWSKAGLFEKLLRFINADASNSTLLEMDSTFCKVHHVIINERTHVLNVVLTGGHIHLEELGAVVCIPDKSNFKMKHKFDAELYKQRNIVEQFFQRIKNYRRVAFRFDKLAGCFLNFILLASTAIHF